jgi:hypothetical protein
MWIRIQNYVTQTIGPGFGYESESNRFATIRLADPDRYFFGSWIRIRNPGLFTVFVILFFGDLMS